MTPAEEKAEELFIRFNKEGLHQISSIINRFVRKEIIKQCALVAVNEMIEETDTYYDTLIASERKLFLEEVKEEIKKL